MKKFTREEVEKLVKFAYETGLCDGEEPRNMKTYRSVNDFWNSNKENWIHSEINYIK